MNSGDPNPPFILLKFFDDNPGTAAPEIFNERKRQSAAYQCELALIKSLIVAIFPSKAEFYNNGVYPSPIGDPPYRANLIYQILGRLLILLCWPLI